MRRGLRDSLKDMRKDKADTNQSPLQGVGGEPREDAKAPFRGLGGFRGRRLGGVLLTLVAVSLSVAYLVWAACAFGGRPSGVACTSLELTFLDGGEYRLVDSAYVEQYLAAGGLHPVGKKRSEIHTEQIEAGLDGSELIKSAECYLTPSGVAHMRVRQRVPKFRVMGGDDYYVDADRHVLRPAAGYAAYLPVVSGSVLPEMATGELFDFVCFLEDNDFWNAQIEQIYVRPDRKVELVPRVGDGIILLGTLDGYEGRLAKLKKLYTEAFNEIGWNRYKLIDLQYEGQVVCTRAR